MDKLRSVTNKQLGFEEKDEDDFLGYEVVPSPAQSPPKRRSPVDPVIGLKSGETRFKAEGWDEGLEEIDPWDRNRAMRQDGGQWPYEEGEGGSFEKSWVNQFLVREEILAKDPNVFFLTLVAGALHEQTIDMYNRESREAVERYQTGARLQQARALSETRLTLNELSLERNKVSTKVSEQNRKVGVFQQLISSYSRHGRTLEKIDEYLSGKLLLAISDATQQAVASGGIQQGSSFWRDMRIAFSIYSRFEDPPVSVSSGQAHQQNLMKGVLKFLDIKPPDPLTTTQFYTTLKEYFAKQTTGAFLSQLQDKLDSLSFGRDLTRNGVELFHLLLVSDVLENTGEIAKVMRFNKMAPKYTAEPTAGEPTDTGLITAGRFMRFLEVLNARFDDIKNPSDDRRTTALVLDYRTPTFLLEWETIDAELQQMKQAVSERSERSAEYRKYIKSWTRGSVFSVIVARKVGYLQNELREEQRLLQYARDELELIEERLTKMRVGVPTMGGVPLPPYRHSMVWAMDPINTGVVRVRAEVIEAIATSMTQLRTYGPDWIDSVDEEFMQHDPVLRAPFAKLVALNVSDVVYSHPNNYIPSHIVKTLPNKKADIMNSLRNNYDVRFDPAKNKLVGFHAVRRMRRIQ